MAHKSYPHVLHESRERADLRRLAASAKHDRLSREWHAEYALLQLQEIGEHGLPDCYAQPTEYLYDFWADLPWDRLGQRATVQLMLADTRWAAIVEAVKAAVGLDMDAELRGCTEPRHAADPDITIHSLPADCEVVRVGLSDDEARQRLVDRNELRRSNEE